MKPETLLLELEALCEQSGYRIRKERGSFKGDSCIMEGDKLILINKNRPLETQINIMARILKNIHLEEIYIKPAVRKKLADIWDRIALHSKSESQDTDQ